VKHLIMIFTTMFVFFIAASAQGEPDASATICASIASGNWSAAATWSCGHVPLSIDDVVIASGHMVTLDTDAAIAHLTASGTLTFGDDKMDRVLSVSDSILINSSGTIDIGKNTTHALNLGGDFTNNGSFAGFAAGGNRVINVTLNGARLQTISGTGATDFNDLAINSGTRAVFPATNLPTVRGTMTVNTGGAVQQTQTVSNSTVSFLQVSSNKYRGVDLITTHDLGSVTIVITTTVNGGCTSTGTSSPAYATRCYEITPTNNVTASVRLYALSTQLNGIAQANLRIYRYAGGWQGLATNASTGSDGGSYSYAQADTPGFSDFLLGGVTTPTAIELARLSARSTSEDWLLPIGFLGMVAIAIGLKRRRR
jgi:hypothetical protein